MQVALGHAPRRPASVDVGRPPDSKHKSKHKPTLKHSLDGPVVVVEPGIQAGVHGSCSRGGAGKCWCQGQVVAVRRWSPADIRRWSHVQEPCRHLAGIWQAQHTPGRHTAHRQATHTCCISMTGARDLRVVKPELDEDVAQQARRERRAELWQEHTLPLLATGLLADEAVACRQGDGREAQGLGQHQQARPADRAAGQARAAIRTSPGCRSGAELQEHSRLHRHTAQSTL